MGYLFPPISRPDQSRRVVVTGLGMVTPMGLGIEANVEGFREGRRCFRPVTLFDVSAQRAKAAAEIILPAQLPPTRLNSHRERRLDRGAVMLIHAMHEALGQANWTAPGNTPVVMGTTSGGMAMGELYYRNAVQNPQSPKLQPTKSIAYQARQQCAEACDAFGLTGPVTIIANACASGANAVGHAFDLVRSGAADRAVAGGYDALAQLVFAGFDSLQALSTTTCRPFDANRDGLALGEGAAVLTLETMESARSRGAQVLAEVTGYGAATDVHHLTQPHPQGDAALATMTEACRMAGIQPDGIGYINAHGTGTPLNDGSEANAISRWAGDAAPKIPVSSTKASIGHLLGAAGAVEVGICILALRGQWLPPMQTLQQPDPACTFPLVTAPASAKLEQVMTNSFGFGGANASVVLRRCA